MIRFWGNDIKKHTDICIKVIEETIFDIIMQSNDYIDDILPILHPDLLFSDRFVTHQLIRVQILPVHIHPGNLMIVISGIIIDSLICVTAGGVNRDLTITILKLAAAPLLVYGIQNMKKLADAFLFAIP